MLGIVDLLGFFDQHDRNPVTNCVPTMQARVVQALLGLDQVKLTFVLRTDEYMNQLRIDRHEFQLSFVLFKQM